ncbi:hypothetical protein [Balneicella halophila]|nr:hypothetical protein [Balneicella halophila]
MTNLIILFLFTFFINIPFGYWRGGEKKFSWQWFVAIHVPVVFLYFMRNWLELEYTWVTFPVLLAIFFLGQYVGKRWRQKRMSQQDIQEI